MYLIPTPQKLVEKKEKLGKYLTPSEEKMKAKGVKSVASRVCNLKELNPEITVEKMRVALQEAFEEVYGTYEVLEETTLDVDAIQSIYDEYASWEWRLGKSPECETVRRTRFSWGEVEVHLKLKNLHVQECKVFSDALDVTLPEKIEKMLINQRYDLQNVDTDDAQLKDVIQWLAQE